MTAKINFIKALLHAYVIPVIFYFIGNTPMEKIAGFGAWLILGLFVYGVSNKRYSITAVYYYRLLLPFAWLALIIAFLIAIDCLTYVVGGDSWLI